MNHYDVLGLQIPDKAQVSVTQHEVKQAYRQALLKYHPDKASPTIKTQLDQPTDLSKGCGASRPTVDDISIAYQTLSDPKARAEYDRELRLRSRSGKKIQEKFHTGLDVVDLDDLAYDEKAQVWYRQCRCGQERGYSITEEQLEDVADVGEIVVGCRGCSLWLKALFSVVEEG